MWRLCSVASEIHRIERDEEMIARLIELERTFWRYVETDTPPPADGTASAESALRCLYPADDGQTVDFRDQPGLSAAFVELRALRQSIEEKHAREAQLKQMLQQAMGEATRAEFANGYVSWRKAKDSIGFDVARLLRTGLICETNIHSSSPAPDANRLITPIASPWPAHAV